MTPTELHELMEPCREAMVKDGIWPTRDVRWKLALCLEVWLWRNEVSPATALQCHPDDAHNAFLAALLGWLMETSMQHPEAWKESAENSIDRVRVTGSIGWDMFDVHGPTLLHALVSAYRQAQGIK